MVMRIIKTKCRRCGKELHTLTYSLYGADQAKAQLDRICADCITPEERYQIGEAIAQAIIRR